MLSVMSIWKISAWISFSMFSIIPFFKALSAYQKNRYKMDRYSHWFKDQFLWEFRSFLYYILLALPFIMMEYCSDIIAYLLFVGFTVLYTMVRFYKCDWKKLFESIDWTMRMLRSAIVLFVLHFMWMYLFIDVMNTTSLGWGCVFAYIGSWFLVYVVWFVLYPVEWLIGYYYRKQARSFMNQFDGISVAITGSYGKTSCKYILDKMLSTKYYGLMTPKSYNTAMGITGVIRKMLKPIHQYFICEMGSDHPGEIANMMEICHPKYGVITAIGPQHLQTFGTMRNIVEEKMSLVEKLDVDGVCFLNKDNAYIREYEIQNPCKKVWFSMLTEADYQVVNMYQTSEITQFTVLVDGMYYEFETRLLGKHNVMNLLAMISVAHTLGMDMAILQGVVKHMPCIEHRLERKDFQGRTLIDNSYSSNIESMKESLEILSMMPNKKIIITPGLVDLAYMADETHYQFGSLMKEKVDIVILVGESQTSMIYNGLIENGFSEEHIYVVNSMAEGLSKSLEVSEVNDTILIENDLPAVYMAASDIKKGGK